MKKIVTLAAMSLLLSATAFAQSVKEKKAQDTINEKSKATAAVLKEKCGVEIPIMPDKSFNTLELLEGPALWCIHDGEFAIKSVCEDADYKAAVAKSVKKVTCVYDPSLTNKGSVDKYGNKFSLKGGVLEWRYNKDSANLYEYAIEFLKGAL